MQKSKQDKNEGIAYIYYNMYFDCLKFETLKTSPQLDNCDKYAIKSRFFYEKYLDNKDKENEAL